MRLMIEPKIIEEEKANIFLKEKYLYTRDKTI